MKRLRARKLRERRRKYRAEKRRRRLNRQRAYRKAQYKRYKKKKHNTAAKRRAKKVVTTAWSTAPKNGPIQIVVSIPDQRMTVMKNGHKIVTSKVSTGRSGYDTPTGIFSILEKRRRHYSNLYDSAPMPHMQRLTWSGIALHGSGHVPGYPASHGCVRLPFSFASQLFKFTKRGAHVVLTHGSDLPRTFVHPNLLQPADPQTPAETVRLEPTSFKVLRGPDMSGLDTAEKGDELVDLNGLRMASLDVDKESMSDVEALVVPAQPTPRVTRSNAPLRILITRRTGRDRILDTQRLLNALGYDAGPADGLFGRNTIAAIRAFQESLGLQETGTLNEETEFALSRASGRTGIASGHIYVRQKFRELFDEPITIENPDEPLGTHLFTALYFDKDASKATWTAITLPGSAGEIPSARATPEVPELAGGPDSGMSIASAGTMPGTAENAIARVKWPEGLRRRLSELLTPGSSIAIADEGMSRETGRGTDFIVLTQ